MFHQIVVMLTKLVAATAIGLVAANAADPAAPVT